MYLRLCFSLILTILLQPSLSSAQNATESFSRIAFGSCMRENKPQPIWQSVLASKPDCFIFTGDNIYGDTHDMDVLKKKWATLGAVPGYQKLKQACPIFATWDDHDYGQNDAGVEYPEKVASQQIFLDFFDEPKDSVRRTTPGIYDAKVCGPKGKRVQIILLDTRYFRSPLVKRSNPTPKAEGRNGHYDPNTDKDSTLLGAEQWTWLEEQLKVPAELRVIATSIQAIPNGHHWEKWGNFPHERTRLFKLIKKTKAGGVIFISGDRHSSEISRLTGENIKYPVYEVTSSALNNSGGGWFNEVNEHRVGVPYTKNNFGLIDIDWEASDPTISLQIVDEAGRPVIIHNTTLNTIHP